MPEIAHQRLIVRNVNYCGSYALQVEAVSAHILTQSYGNLSFWEHAGTQAVRPCRITSQNYHYGLQTMIVRINGNITHR